MAPAGTSTGEVAKLDRDRREPRLADELFQALADGRGAETDVLAVVKANAYGHGRGALARWRWRERGRRGWGWPTHGRASRVRRALACAGLSREATEILAAVRGVA